MPAVMFGLRMCVSLDHQHDVMEVQPSVPPCAKNRVAPAGGSPRPAPRHGAAQNPRAARRPPQGRGRETRARPGSPIPNGGRDGRAIGGEARRLYHLKSAPPPASGSPLPRRGGRRHTTHTERRPLPPGPPRPARALPLPCLPPHCLPAAPAPSPAPAATAPSPRGGQRVGPARRPPTWRGCPRAARARRGGARGALAGAGSGGLGWAGLRRPGPLSHSHAGWGLRSCEMSPRQRPKAAGLPSLGGLALCGRSNR